METISRRMLGRLAGVLFLFAGGATLASFPFDAPTRSSDAVVAGASAAAIVVGGVCVLVPWDRWPRWSSLVLVPLALALVAISNAYGSAPNHAYSTFFVLIYVWIGIRQDRWVPLAFAPLLVSAYVGPLMARPELSEVSAAVVAVPTIVIVGETLAWIGSRLRAAERELEARVRERAAEASALRTQDELKNVFLRGVAHDLRGPLTVISGYAQMLESRELDEDGRSMLEGIISGVERLEALMADSLGIERLERVYEPQRRLTSAADVFAESIHAIGDDANAVSVAMDDVTGTIDPGMASRAVENLIRNAFLHTPAGSAIGVRASAIAGGIEFVVDDDGPGVPDDQKHAIFEPFVRGSTSSDGSGLGLSLVRSLAEAHGGRAWVEDRPGGGASFHVLFPGPEPG